jgi:hypothetical protein
VIDITCSACDITYQADETKVGQGFRCKLCGKLLLVDHQTLGASVLRNIEQATAPVYEWKGRQQIRDRWIAIGILVGGGIFLGVWLWTGASRPTTPPAPSTTDQGQAIPPEPVPQTPTSDLKPKIRRFTSWLGKRGWRARLEKQGLERIREIARENGRKFGGRPRLPEDRLTPAGLRTRRYRERLKAERAEARKEGE